ncbi:MAG: FAD:protein FMN transferase [Oscillospiraceae bacterium]|nr:FAD:protein FMN transferase [Oscillospiraceae bacterium]
MKRLICLFLICILLSGCGANTQKTLYHMNTVMHLQLWGKDCETAAARCDVILRDLESLWSVTDANSSLSAINRGQDVKLDGPYQALLNQVEALSQRTGGAFNPKLYALSNAWGFYNEEFRVPTAEEITEALSQEQWDLGAALKGYAGYRLTLELDKLKVDRAMLNLGGNIQTYGEKADGSPWKIGIQNPDGGDYLGIISVTGTMAVVTSGDYQRYFEVDGVRYHHILDPETGFPADSGLRSVTVICDDGLTADAFSTALFVMGLEDGTRFWRASDDFEAVFITNDGKIHATEGVNLSGCDYEVIFR